MATSPTQPRRRLSKETRRAQLLVAAEVVFSEAGYSGATMELVAAHDGVTRSLLYEHFASIDELYVECHRAAREEMQLEVVGAALQAGPELHDQLRVGLAAYFRYFAERPQRFDLLYGHPGGRGPACRADRGASVHHRRANRRPVRRRRPPHPAGRGPPAHT